LFFLLIDGSSIKCIESNSILQHPTDCTKYIQCFQNKPTVKSCQPGLHFNPNSNVCDLSPNAGCIEKSSSTIFTTEKSSEPTTVSQTHTSTETQKETDKTTEDYNKITEESPLLNQTESLVSGGTEGSVSGGTVASTDYSTNGLTDNSTPDPTDNLESTTKSSTCHRDIDIDLGLDNDCSDCSSAYSKAHPNSANQYILCKNGMKRIVKCSPGLIFDFNRQTCDYKGLVEQNLLQKSKLQGKS
jgi:hypothetical protein